MEILLIVMSVLFSQLVTDFLRENTYNNIIKEIYFRGYKLNAKRFGSFRSLLLSETYGCGNSIYRYIPYLNLILGMLYYYNNSLIIDDIINKLDNRYIILPKEDNESINKNANVDDIVKEFDTTLKNENNLKDKKNRYCFKDGSFSLIKNNKGTYDVVDKEGFFVSISLEELNIFISDLAVMDTKDVKYSIGNDVVNYFVNRNAKNINDKSIKTRLSIFKDAFSKNLEIDNKNLSNYTFCFLKNKQTYSAKLCKYYFKAINDEDENLLQDELIPVSIDTLLAVGVNAKKALAVDGNNIIIDYDRLLFLKNNNEKKFVLFFQFSDGCIRIENNNNIVTVTGIKGSCLKYISEHSMDLLYTYLLSVESFAKGSKFEVASLNYGGISNYNIDTTLEEYLNFFKSKDYRKDNNRSLDK